MKLLRRTPFALAFGAMAVLLPSTASAHFKFLEPPSTWVTENGGKGVLPCGEGIPSGVVTKAQGGHRVHDPAAGVHSASGPLSHFAGCELAQRIAERSGSRGGRQGLVGQREDRSELPSLRF